MQARSTTFLNRTKDVLFNGTTSKFSTLSISPKSVSGKARVQIQPYNLKCMKGYINGEWVDSSSGKTFDVENPADYDIVTRVPCMTKEDTQNAINAAKNASWEWSQKSIVERCAIVKRMRDTMIQELDGLAVLLSLESGKPLKEARGEVKYAADFLEWFSEEGKRLYGQVIPTNANNRRLVTLYQPVGPCGLLTPWNFPMAMPARKIAPALVAGCTIVLRPSAETPLSAIALAQIAEECGVPPGVFNLILGEDHEATSGVLTQSEDIKKVSFTGSTRVGKSLVRDCADTLKRTSMELGGQAPFIVFGDADIDAAVNGAMESKFRNAGQTCVCANTFFVHETVYDEFVSKFKERMQKLKVGDGLTEDVDVGPLITKKALESADKFVQDAIEKGAEVLLGGKVIAEDVNQGKGNFFAPTLLSNVTEDVACVREEIFGPVAPVMKFKTEEEIIGFVNKASLGLAGYFYTRDLSRAWRVAEALEVGMVGVNTGAISSASAPFGGIKESGFGREGGREGLLEYVNMKYMVMGI